jgi:hypothetical protein
MTKINVTTAHQIDRIGVARKKILLISDIFCEGNSQLTPESEEGLYFLLEEIADTLKDICNKIMPPEEEGITAPLDTIECHHVNS